MVSASVRCDARMRFGLLPEKRFLPAQLNRTRLLHCPRCIQAQPEAAPFRLWGTRGLGNGLAASNGGMRSCVCGIPRGRRGGGGGGGGGAPPPPRHAVGTGKLPLGGRFACAPYRLRFALLLACIGGKAIFQVCPSAAAPPCAPFPAGGQPSSPRHSSFNAAPLLPADGGAAVRAGKSP